MDAPPAPGHSPVLEKWVLRKRRSSVVFVMITPRKGQIKAFKARMKEANILKEPKERDDEVSRNRVGTGFVVESGKNGTKIVTCAHLIDYVFTARGPISAEEANALFQTQVLCDHAEVAYTEAIAAGRTTSRRAYSSATIVDINCEKDLMLLQIPSASIYGCFSPTNRKLVCTRQHPPIYPALNPPEPEPFDNCVMISWPSEKHMTSVTGSVSHCSRTIKVMAGDNPNGYSMKLLQANIRSEGGASGSALLNEKADCIGVLHGGDVQFSYFVSWEDLSLFLDKNSVAGRA